MAGNLKVKDCLKWLSSKWGKGGQDGMEGKEQRPAKNHVKQQQVPEGGQFIGSSGRSRHPRRRAGLDRQCLWPGRPTSVQLWASSSLQSVLRRIVISVVWRRLRRIPGRLIVFQFWGLGPAYTEDCDGLGPLETFIVGFAYLPICRLLRVHIIIVIII